MTAQGTAVLLAGQELGGGPGTVLQGLCDIFQVLLDPMICVLCFELPRSILGIATPKPSLLPNTSCGGSLHTPLL
jgi:hypothetical protein